MYLDHDGDGFNTDEGDDDFNVDAFQVLQNLIQPQNAWKMQTAMAGSSSPLRHHTRNRR